MNVFLPADILIPDVESMEKWSVIACDQFSSQPEYWKDVKISSYQTTKGKEEFRIFHKSKG